MNGSAAPATRGAVVVEATGVSRRFGRYWALRDVSLTVAAGEGIVLVGENGAGKSTLLTLLSTLSRPTVGSVSLFGQDSRKSLASVRRRMGYLPHSTLLDDALSARENLVFYGALFGLDNIEDRVSGQLTRVGLADRADDRAGTFSRGMRQRLSLARALLHEPELLLLDEPFSGLDAPGIRDLSARLAQEKQDGRAVVLVTHQLDPVLSWSDQVAVLHRGALVELSACDVREAAEWSIHLAQVAEGKL